MNIARRNLTVVACATMAGALVLASMGVSLAGQKSPADEDASSFATMTTVAERGPARRATIDATFLSRFNSGERDYASLELGELPVDSAPAYQLSEAVQKSDVVVVAELERMTFYSGELADIPISVWTVRPQTILKGAVGRGEKITIEVFGGPIAARFPNEKDAFVTLSGLPVPVPGDRLVLFLVYGPDAAREPLYLSNWLNTYIIRSGAVSKGNLSRMAGIDGMPEKVLVDVLKTAVQAE